MRLRAAQTRVQRVSQTRAQPSTQKRRRRTQRRRRRSEKRTCGDTIEESASLVDEADARRKRARCYKEVITLFPLTHPVRHFPASPRHHLQNARLLLSRHAAPWSAPPFTWTSSHDASGSALACSSPGLNDTESTAAHAGVRLGEAQNPWPATHDRDRAAAASMHRQPQTYQRKLETQCRAARTPSCGEFKTCKKSDPPAAQTVLFQPQHHRRCPTLGDRSPSAAQIPPPSGTVSDLGGQCGCYRCAAVADLDRACCMWFRKPGGQRHAGRRKRWSPMPLLDREEMYPPPRPSLLRDTFQDRRQIPDTRLQRPIAGPPFSNLLRARSQVLPGDPLDDNPLPNCPFRGISHGA